MFWNLLVAQVNDKRKNIKKNKPKKQSNIRSIHFERYETFRFEAATLELKKMVTKVIQLI